ncbi:bis(5'-nucleosyl)-tetraphosphatase (symmetrical) YqeK [Loigolactobacillus jiayinensis]|uniref:bis(5'-nucleosyl)-tetraphosphatase (symmetrical) n=1 Tax=Loigolactobacillus jiayinensis TaxID=2486016 RepID=A0ABW1RCQ6_9LACO|nr:bis(5'-nucleosyl)-tetraphosphatase (symmetrical) YqeK [Loigolactobacillus jiayinensis]
MKNTDIDYPQTLVPLSRADLLARLHAQLSDGRFAHVQRVEQTAIKLAQQYGGDVQRAGLAGLVHDYAKQRPDAEFKQLIRQQRFDPDLLTANNGIWHGVIGAYLVERELGIHDTQVLNAIRRHTIGAVEMTTLDKIIFVADFIEPGRDFPGVDQARAAAEASLDAGVRFEITNTLKFLIAKQVNIYPKTIDTYNAWVAGH